MSADGPVRAAPGDGAREAGGRARVPERRRAVALGLVAVTLALAGVANATIRPGGRDRALHLASQASPVVVTNGASSSAWYCAGPLPVGTPGEASSIAVTNVGRSVVTGEVVVSSTTGGSRDVSRLTVPAGQESVVGLTRLGARGVAAVTVLVNGSGVAVEEIVHGASGISAAPCVNHADDTAYIAAGSTIGADNLSLAVLDPGSTPSVVSISFATSSGIVAPPPFQGVTVGAGALAVFDVGHYVPSNPAVATIVSATGGRVVAGAAITAVVGHAVMSSLVGDVAAPAASWLFPAAPSGPTSASTFAVLDPSDRPATVKLAVVSSTTRSELSAVVPAHGVVHLVPGADTAPGALRWATVTSTGPGVVVARETVLTATPVTAASRRAAEKRAAARRAAAAKAAAAARRAAAKVVASSRGGHASAHARVAPTTTVPPVTSTTVVPYAVVSSFPSLQPGVAVSSGVARAGRTWVLPGGESDANTSEVVVVDNTSARAATVDVAQLDAAGSGPLGSSPFASMPPLTVPAGAILTVDMAAVVGEQPGLPLLVSTSEPVVVGQLLYGRAASGTGFTLPAAISVR
ncbi:MAG TPA: DUF5719 family protein [Acidimicrobiales bacterium]|nr:DUF5719 family protein [Acidimicrobiales bacterium]